MSSGEKVSAIRAALQSRHPAVADALNRAASSAEVNDAESRLGGRLPASVREAYLVANGTSASQTVFFLDGLFRWLPLDEMVNATAQFRSLASEFPELYPAGTDSLCVIADPRNGDLFCVRVVDDAASESALLLKDHERADLQIIRDSFGDYLSAFLSELGENPNVAVIEDFGQQDLVDTLQSLGVPASEL